MKLPLSAKKLGFLGMVAIVLKIQPIFMLGGELGFMLAVLKIQPIFMLGGELGFMLAWVNYEYCVIAHRSGKGYPQKKDERV